MTGILHDYWPYLLVIAVIALSFLPIRLHLRFYREPNGIAVISHLLFWFVPVRINMVNPVTRFVWNLSVNRPWQKKPPADVRAGKVRWANLIFRLNRLRKISRSVWSGANSFFLKIGKPIKIKELSLYTEIAREDAAQTAISAGFVWAAQGFLYTRLAEIFNTRNSRNYFMVRPAYTKTNFLLVDYSCIFQFRLGHIIIIIYQMFRSTGEIYSLIRRVSQ